ncbi:MAG: hypothetical protein AB7T38_15680 [Nitrospirales bacterium]
MNDSLSFSPPMGSGKLSTWFLFVVLGPVLCAFSGFHAASYLLTGLYTWPRTSRVLVLTIGMLIFSYEFIFKHSGPLLPSGKTLSQKEWVLYTCVIPYAVGVGALAIMAGLTN